MPTDSQPVELIDQAKAWVLAGQSESDILEALRERGADDPEKPLIAAMESIADSIGPPEVMRGFCFEAAREVYRDARKANDFGAALRALKFIHDLGGG